MYLHTQKIVLEFIPVRNKFIELFDRHPRLFSAPGRINLIGEHTDYNDGFVLPAAIDKEVVFAINSNQIKKFRFFAFDFNHYFEADKIEPTTTEFHWANYLLGVLAQFEKEGIIIQGVDCVFGSNIPVGAGLSSSAAIECGFAFGLNEIFKSNFTRHQLVLMAQKAEHEYAGVFCGVMDQFASIFGKKDHVILLDCRDYSHKYFPIKIDGYSICLCDTTVKHSLASSEYNIRRQECETGVSILKTFDAKISALRDVSIDYLTANKLRLNPIVYKRCKYIVEENKRVQLACKYLVNSEIENFGQLLYQTHEGLQNEFEVSCKELDILVEATKKMDYVLGARMMGGGFGGCTINFVKSSFVDSFKKNITKYYNQQTNKNLKIYQVGIKDGANKIKIN